MMSSGSDPSSGGDEADGGGGAGRDGNAAERLAAWGRVFERLFDPHPSNVALVGLDGTVLAVNAAWRRYAADHGVDPGYDFVGRNYLAACEAGVATGYPSAREAYVGLLGVLRNRRPKFTLVYSCHTPVRREWYRMWVEPQTPSVPAVIVAHQLIQSKPYGGGNGGGNGGGDGDGPGPNPWASPDPSGTLDSGTLDSGPVGWGAVDAAGHASADPVAAGLAFPGWWFGRYDGRADGGTEDRSHDRT